MGWRGRLGGRDERAAVAARARALLATAPPGRVAPPPSAAAAAAGELVGEPVVAEPVAPSAASAAIAAAGGEGADARRGGWVPTTFAPLGDVAPRHGSESEDEVDAPDGSGRPVPGPDGWAGWASEPPARAGAAGWRERFRLDPGRRGLLAVAALAVVVASVVGGLVFHGRSSGAVTVSTGPAAPVPMAGTTGSPGSSAPSPGPAATAAAGTTAGTPAGGPASRPVSATTGTVTVDVAGQVARPGVYTLPAGSRVEDALTAAGGALAGADLSTVNRARVLADGEQIAIGVPGAPGAAPPAGPATGGGGASPAGLVDLNTADLAALDTLPGVGPVLAQHILDWRTEHGRFDSVDQLQQVSGIGPSRFDDLKALVRV